VIAPSFGDIFFENSFKNSLLPIVMNPADMAAIARDKAFVASSILSVDLQACRVTVPDGMVDIAFAVEESRRKALLMGLDHIDLTLMHASEIASFQARDRSRRPWIYRSEQNDAG